MPTCESTDSDNNRNCPWPATRIVRVEDPGDKRLRHLCKAHAKPYADTQLPRGSRDRWMIQRLPHRVGGR